jgi:hypothetical protein
MLAWNFEAFPSRKLKYEPGKPIRYRNQPP